MDADETRGTEAPGRMERYRQWRRTPWWQRSRRSRVWIITAALAWGVVCSIAFQLVKGAFGW